MHPRTSNSPQVVLPKPQKKIMAIVDPQTNKEIKVSKADASPSSRASNSTSPPVSAPIKVEPPPARPLAVVPDPSDLDAPSSNNPTSRVGAVEKNSKNADPNLPKSDPEPSSEATDVHGAHDTASASPDLTGPSRPADIPIVPKNNVSLEDPNVPQTRNSTEQTVTPPSKNISVSPESQPIQKQASDTPASTVSACADTAQRKGPPSTIDSSASFVTNQSGDSNTTPGQVETSGQPTLQEDSPTSPTPVEQMVPNGNAEKKGIVVNESGRVEDSTASLDLSESKLSRHRLEQPQAEEDADVAIDTRAKLVNGISEVAEEKVEAEEDIKDETGSSASQGAPSSKDELVSDSVPSEDQVVTFAPGQRRVYAPDLLRSLRSSANQKRVAEFKSAMTPSDIFGSSRSGQVGSNRSVSSRSGLLSSDPRGTRAFPPHSSSGFQIPSRGPPLSGMIGPGGFYDGSDIKTPLFAPPPVSRIPSARDGDPRGTRTQRPNQRGFDGFMRRGQAPVEAVVQQPPVEKLKRSATGWHRNKEADDEVTAKVKQVRSLLNKLTLEKFDKIFSQIVAIDLSSYEVLVGVVEEIFEKTLFEPKFSDMYAELCSRLDHTIQPILNKKSDSNEQLNFRRILLNNCKEEFVRFANSSKPAEPSSETDQSDSAENNGDGSKPSKSNDDVKTSEETDLDKEEAELKASKAKRRMLANVRFIGELFLKDLLSENIIHKQCIQKLLGLATDTKEEDVLEAICKLISKTGLKLSMNPKAVGHIEHYFQLLVQLSKDQSVPARIRFMIQDLVEQRENGWKVRREEAGAKTIAEIHQDIEKEEKAKAEAANALRDRRSRGGGSGRHSNPGPNYPPRVSMMMASRPTSTPGMSRTNLTLEKLNNVKASGFSSSTLPQGMRLGPGGRGSMSSASSGAPALRPNGSRSFGGSRYSLLSSMNMSDPVSTDDNSGDVRRSKSSKPASISSRPASEPGPSLPKVELLDPTLVKRKTKSILEEYWDISDLKEATSCLEEEIKSPNYAVFMEEAVKLSLEAKMENCEKSCTLFSTWISSKTVSSELFLSVFQKFGPMLEDIEMDFPRVSESFARIAFSLSEVDEFKEVGGGKYGLGWMKKVFDACDEKKTITKFVVRVLYYEYKSHSNLSDEERMSEVIAVYRSLDIDLSAELSAWDDMMGPRTLRSILDRVDMLFLVDTMDAELQLRAAVESDPTLDDCVGALRCFKGSTEGQSGMRLIQMAIRVGLDSVFVLDGNAKMRVDQTFKVVVEAVHEVFGDSITSDLQLAALRAMQAYIARNDNKVAQGSKDFEWAEAACRALFDTKIVARDQFLQWKSGDEVSEKMAGKEQMVKATAAFFTWLNEAGGR